MGLQGRSSPSLQGQILPLPRPLLLLLLLLLLCPITCQSAVSRLCDGEELRSILSDVDLPSCLAEGSSGQAQKNCSLLRHFEQLAEGEGKSLSSFMSRVTIAVLAHSEFTMELVVPGNPVLEMEPELKRHYAFIGVTKCLKAANSTCQRLRISCFGGFVSHFAFMVSGHCSKAWGCSPIYNNNKDKPTTLLNLLPYVHYRLIERQAFIAKELGELQLSTSTSSEYLIQTELNDTYGSQLILNDSLPLAVFSTGPVKTLTYYQQLVWFLDTAISLRNLFAFHVIVTPLSQLETESERPMYRWKVGGRESFLAVYTRQLCSSNPTWAFTCKPLISMSNELLFAEQYASFLLHGALSGSTLAGAPFTTLGSPTEHLNAFVRMSTSYVLAVMPVDEMLTDPRVNLEVMKALVSYLGSSFGATYYPVVLSKATALQILKGLNTGLDLDQAFYRPSFFIRLPTRASVVLKIDEPIAVLDKTVREAANSGNYQITLQSAREMLSTTEMVELPERMTNVGHIAGDTAAEDDAKEIVEANWVKGRTDAFAEQVKFKDVYNVTGVLVVESNPELMRDFFDRLGQEKPWLVLFTVSWSPLCKAARAIWSSVGQCAVRLGFPEVQLVKVDCFEANEICRKLNVTTYPTISMFSKGVQLSTYSGPIMSNALCLYTKLAFLPPVIASSSEKETQRILSEILSLRPRAFLLRGQEMPSRLTALAKSLRFREVIVHEKTVSSSGGRAQLTAMYSDVRPNSNRYSGSLDDSNGLLDFVQNGHLDSVFPCSWTYLPQALSRERSLVILFHLGAKDEAPSLLEHLHDRFGDRATVCHLNLRNFAHLNDLVRRLAGLSLPALVVLVRPPGAADRVTHRLALGAFPTPELPARTADWLDRALSHRLTDGRPVEASEKWQPASQVFNFVDQVYHGKSSKVEGHKPHSSRAFTVQASGMADGDEDGADGDAKTMRSPKMSGGQATSHGAGSMRDEL